MILGAADLHLRLGAKYFNRRFSGDALYGLAQLAAAAVKSQAAAVILAGDIFNSATPDGVTLNAYTEFMRSSMVPILVLPGNHDRVLLDDLPECLRPTRRELGMLHPGAFLIPSDGNTIEIDGMSVAGLPYCPPGPAAIAALQAVPPCDLLVCHHAWKHQLAFDGAWHFTLDMLPKHVGMVLNGHVHVPDVSSLDDTGKRWFVSPGSTWPTLAEEFTRPHCAVKIEKGKRPEFVNLNVRRYRDARSMTDMLETSLGLMAVEHREAGFLLKTLVQVSELPDNHQERWPELVLIQSGLSLREASEAAEDELVEEAAADLLANLPAVLDREKRPEAYALLQTLLEHPDPRQASDLLQDWLKARIKPEEKTDGSK